MAIVRKPQSHQSEIEKFIARAGPAKDDKRLAAKPGVRLHQAVRPRRAFVPERRHGRFRFCRPRARGVHCRTAIKAISDSHRFGARRGSERQIP
jgi:hypothetical protein